MCIFSTSLTRRRSAADLMATPSFHRPLWVPTPLPFVLLGPQGSLWERFRGLLGSPWGCLGVPEGDLGSLLGASGGTWEPPGGILGISWAP